LSIAADATGKRASGDACAAAKKMAERIAKPENQAIDTRRAGDYIRLRPIGDQGLLTRVVGSQSRHQGAHGVLLHSLTSQMSEGV
jgi:hypothetical protein